MSVDPKITKRTNSSTHINECLSKKSLRGQILQLILTSVDPKVTKRTNSSTHTGMNVS